MRVSTGCWIAVALVSVATCLQVSACQPVESFPMAIPPPPDAGLHVTSSASSGGPDDAGCSLMGTVCSPVDDTGPDASCPTAGTVTGTVVSGAACTTDLISLGGPVTDAGCCSSTCLQGGCRP